MVRLWVVGVWAGRRRRPRAKRSERTVASRASDGRACRRAAAWRNS